MAKQSLNDLAVFRIAFRIESDELREDYLRQACGDDQELYDRVSAILKANADSQEFLESPINGVAATIDLPPIAERPGTEIGPYKLLQEIGEGGMGVVYMAEQREPVRRKVALKIVKPGMDTRQVVARFEAERQALALMDHPNIAKVLDAGATDSGRPFFVMELVHGVTITEYCDSKDLTTRERLELFVLVCHAIQHAHQKGIIHRDISAKNILVTMHDGVPVPKVIDFGIAKAVNQELTARTVFTGYGQVIGTPVYMSPEQVEPSGLGVDTRSDIYSLGVLLYELLTGTTPFDQQQLKEAGLDEFRRLIRENEPARPSTRISTMGQAATTVSMHRKTVPARLTETLRRELDWIVMKALEKDRARRYQTANDFARDIQRYLNDEAVEACPPATFYRLRKFTRRNRAAVLTTAAICLASIVGAAVAGGQAYRATKAADRATKAERFAQEQLEIAQEQRRLAKEQEQLAKKQKQLAENAASRERDLRAEAEKQRDLAEEARREADLARQRADAVTKYLVEVFRSPDPRRDGRTITVAEMLDRAVDKLDDDFTEATPLNAVLHDTLSKTYWGLGLRDKSIERQEKAEEIYRQAYSWTPAQGLHGVCWLAHLNCEAGHLPRALELAERAMQIQREELCPEHPAAIRAKEVMSAVLRKSGRIDEAIQLGEEVLAVRQKTCKPDDEDLLDTMNNLALVYQAAGRINDAIALQEEVMDRQIRARGGFGPNAGHNLAWSYHAAGRDEDALKLVESVLATVQKRGDEHPDTLHVKNSLGMIYLELGRLEEGIRILQEVAAVREKLHGRDHPDTLLAFSNLGYAHREAGHYDKAVELLAPVVEQSRKVLGPEHTLTLSSMSHLAAAYHKLDRNDEARALYETVLEADKASAPANYRHAMARRIGAGTFYVDQAEYVKAEPLLVSAYEEFSKRQGAELTPRDKQTMREAAEKLVELYEKQNQSEKAATWKAELDELAEQPEKSNDED